VQGAAAWFTVTAWPPIVTVPERVPPLLAATTMVTVPLPLPDPDAIEIHVTLLEAAQAHAAEVITATEVPVDPAAWIATVDGLTE
jgi:hypothetical protein